MCIGLPAAGLALSGIGTAVNAAGIFNNAAAQQASAAYQAQVAKNNAALASAQGEADAEEEYRLGDAKLGQQRAALGASSFDVNSGSPLSAQLATAWNTGQQVATARYNAAVSAAGYLSQSTLSAARADDSTSLGAFGVGSSLLGGASQFATKWANLGTTGNNLLS